MTIDQTVSNSLTKADKRLLAMAGAGLVIGGALGFLGGKVSSEYFDFLRNSPTYARCAVHGGTAIGAIIGIASGVAIDFIGQMNDYLANDTHDL